MSANVMDLLFGLLSQGGSVDQYHSQRRRRQQDDANRFGGWNDVDENGKHYHNKVDKFFGDLMGNTQTQEAQYRSRLPKHQGSHANLADLLYSVIYGGPGRDSYYED